MNFGWLKRMMPRGLYGRAALILIVPVVTIQLVVSVTFIQRHFEGVTRQMTRSVASEVTFVAAMVNAAPTLQVAQDRVGQVMRPLSLGITLPAPHAPTDNRRDLIDLSGRVVIATFEDAVENVTGVHLLDAEKAVIIGLRTRHGPMEVRMTRMRVSASNPHQLLVLMMSTSVLMTAIAYLFLRNQLRPIKRMAAAAEAFGKGRSVRFRPTGATEVRAAGRAFLEMRDRIERQIEQRTLMLSGVSHDLRTPLTRLKLGLSLVDDGSEEVEELQRDVTDMEVMLDSFLAFARGDAMEDPQLVDPAELLGRIVADGVRAGQAVSVGHIRGRIAPVMLRPMALERALHNLIGNAVRYGTQAEVSLDISDALIRFTVEDDGPGIPAESRGAAMRAFARLDASRNQDRGSGVGLGLAIAADIARSHGGSLKLGESSRFGGLKAELEIAR